MTFHYGMVALRRFIARSASAHASRAATPPAIESLEGRRLLAADHTIVYTLSDDTDPGENAVLAFRQTEDGLVPFGTFPTRGTGLANPSEVIGPNDNDQPLIASPDGKFLFAVNGGSNDISVFRVRDNGALSLVGRFGSRGVRPVSVGLSGKTLIVVNQGGDDVGQNTGKAPANYSSFHVAGNGKLVHRSTVVVDNGSAPTQAFVNGSFVYSPELFDDVSTSSGTGPDSGNEQTVIRGFHVRPDGRLRQVELIEGPSSSLNNLRQLFIGIAAHPTQNLLYVGFAGTDQIGVFRTEANGELTQVGLSSLTNNTNNAPCWLVVSADGQRMYSINTFNNSVSVFSLEDPENPVEIQNLVLANSGPTPENDINPFFGAVSSAPKQAVLSPDGRFLYVVAEENRLDNAHPGNQLHVLEVRDDGTVVRDVFPTKLPGFEAGHHSQGVVALAIEGRDDDRNGKGRDSTPGQLKKLSGGDDDDNVFDDDKGRGSVFNQSRKIR